MAIFDEAIISLGTLFLGLSTEISNGILIKIYIEINRCQFKDMENTFKQNNLCNNQFSFHFSLQNVIKTGKTVPAATDRALHANVHVTGASYNFHEYIFQVLLSAPQSNITLLIYSFTMDLKLESASTN